MLISPSQRSETASILRTREDCSSKGTKCLEILPVLEVIVTVYESKIGLTLASSSSSRANLTTVERGIGIQEIGSN